MGYKKGTNFFHSFYFFTGLWRNFLLSLLGDEIHGLRLETQEVYLMNEAEIGLGGKSRKIQWPGDLSHDLFISQLEFT